MEHPTSLFAQLNMPTRLNSACREEDATGWRLDDLQKWTTIRWKNMRRRLSSLSPTGPSSITDSTHGFQLRTSSRPGTWVITGGMPEKECLLFQTPEFSVDLKSGNHHGSRPRRLQRQWPPGRWRRRAESVCITEKRRRMRKPPVSRPPAWIHRLRFQGLANDMLCLWSLSWSWSDARNTSECLDFYQGGLRFLRNSCIGFMSLTRACREHTAHGPPRVTEQGLPLIFPAASTRWGGGSWCSTTVSH